MLIREATSLKDLDEATLIQREVWSLEDVEIVGRIQLKGRYQDEDDVDRAYIIVQSTAAVCSVPQIPSQVILMSTASHAQVAIGTSSPRHS